LVKARNHIQIQGVDWPILASPGQEKSERRGTMAKKITGMERNMELQSKQW
jgi:hypothetical protein